MAKAGDLGERLGDRGATGGGAVRRGFGGQGERGALGGRRGRPRAWHGGGRAVRSPEGALGRRGAVRALRCLPLVETRTAAATLRPPPPPPPRVATVARDPRCGAGWKLAAILGRKAPKLCGVGPGPA